MNVKRLLEKALEQHEVEEQKLTKAEGDLQSLLDALGIANVHNAKQALTKLNRRVEELEATIGNLCERYGVDNFGNLIKKFDGLAKAKVVGNRLPFLTSIPYVGYVSAEKAETCLNRLDKKCRALLDLEPAASRDDLFEYLTEEFRKNSYEDFLEWVVELHALKVHGVQEPPATKAVEESPETEWVNFADQLDSIFVTSHLSPVAVESLRASSASSPGKHITAERFAQSMDQESAVPSRAGQTAFTIAKVLCAEAIFGEVPVPGSDEDVAFQGVTDNQDAFFSVLNEDGLDGVADLVGEALLALEEEALASQ